MSLFLRWFALASLIIPSMLFAQDSDSLNLTNPDTVAYLRNFEIYLEGGLETVPQTEGNESEWTVGLGGSYKGFSAGFFHTTNKGELTSSPFFPRQHNLPFEYTGVTIGKSLIRKESLQAYFKTSFALGKMEWKEKLTSQTDFDDTFQFIQPSLEVSYTISSFVQLYLSGGYRQTIGLSLTEVDPDAYEGMTLKYGIRLGYFKKERQTKP